MKELLLFGVIASIGLTAIFSAPCRGQASLAKDAPEPARATANTKSAGHLLPGVGVGVRASSLGVGGEVAVGVTRWINLRGGFNWLTYSRSFSKDGITYNGQLNLLSAEAHVDVFPFAGRFHVSPGLLAYNGNNITANAAVPGGQPFTLGGTAYLSDPTNPITGKGKLNFVKAAPMILVGWGNLVPRKHSHFSYSTELGVVFQQAPRTTLSLAGNACSTNGLVCVNAATDPNVQASIAAEVAKINKSTSPFKYYPVVSIGVGYKF